MKRLLLSSSLLLISLSLTACSQFGRGRTEAIKDTTTLTSMNEKITSATEYYFDTTIPEDIAFEYEAFKSLIPSPESGKDYIHQSNIFQAINPEDAVEGEISAYGGVLSPNNSAVKGLILNVFNEKVSPKTYSPEELQKIATDFLVNKKLIKEDEPITFVGINEKASSTYISVLNFNTSTTRFAVGVNLQFGTIVYFEHTPLK